MADGNTLNIVVEDGKTMVLDSGVETTATRTINDCPISEGEVLNYVVGLSANGFESGNREIICYTENCTYNTDAVEKGTHFPVTFYSNEVGRGFYVGNKSTTEPQANDWWCFQCWSTKDKGNALTNSYSSLYAKAIVDASYNLFFSKLENSLITSLSATRPTTTASVWHKLRYYKDDGSVGWYGYGVSKEGIFQKNKLNISYKNTNVVDSFAENEIEGLSYIFKPVTASDLLAYENCGVMGALFLSDLSESTYTYYSNNKWRKIEFISLSDLNDRISGDFKGINLFCQLDLGDNKSAYTFLFQFQITAYDASGNSVGSFYCSQLNYTIGNKFETTGNVKTTCKPIGNALIISVPSITLAYIKTLYSTATSFKFTETMHFRPNCQTTWGDVESMFTLKIAEVLSDNTDLIGSNAISLASNEEGGEV